MPYNKIWKNYGFFHLTLCILTTHICVENTVLASMNFFLFNLSYNVMIMCELHQMMYIAIITPSKPTIPPDFRCILPFVSQQSPKCQFFGQITTPKITLIYRQFLIQIICSKKKKSTFTANLKVRPWYLTGSFPLNALRGLYFSHFIRPSLAYLTLPRWHPKRILGNSAMARA